jgi:sulfate permease, SulP family
MKTKANDPDPTETGDLPPEIHLPGLRGLREVVSHYRSRWIPSGATLRKDGVAGLTVAVASVPEGMAGGVLAGVNPIYGLYANIIGPLAGGIFSSTKLMVIQNTSAVSVVAGQSLIGLSSQEHDSALFLMVVLAGVIALASGLLRLGRLTRFVSYSVMTGFLTGIAVVLILSQFATVAGYEVEGANRITQTIDLFRKINQINVESLIMGIVTLVIAIVLQRTPAQSFSALLAIAAPSILVGLLNLDNVKTVADLGGIPHGMSLPSLPSFTHFFDVLSGAFAVALIALIQGAGVSQSVPNPDGSKRRISRDFVAQGLGNIASGLFRGLPVGGSVSTTALNVMAGATRRWAALFSALWLALIVIGVPGLVTHVALPALGAVIILAGLQSIKPSDLIVVWQAGWSARVAAITTFLGMLVLPMQLAVGLGVVVSILLYVSEASSDVSLVELVRRSEGQIEERKPPTQLPSNEITVLDVYGDVFFAGARTLERLLPSPWNAEHPAVILRLRGRTMLGATLVEVLSRYLEKLQKVNGRLYLTGVSEEVNKELARLRNVRLTGPIRVLEATPVRGQSTHVAYVDAQAWLVNETGGPNSLALSNGKTS